MNVLHFDFAWYCLQVRCSVSIKNVLPAIYHMTLDFNLCPFDGVHSNHLIYVVTTRLSSRSLIFSLRADKNIVRKHFKTMYTPYLSSLLICLLMYMSADLCLPLQKNAIIISLDDQTVSDLDSRVHFSRFLCPFGSFSEYFPCFLAQDSADSWDVMSQSRHQPFLQVTYIPY